MKIKLSPINLLFGLMLAGACFIMILWFGTPPIIIFPFVMLCYLISGLLSGNLNSPNEYLYWLIQVLLFMYCANLIFHFLQKKRIYTFNVNKKKRIDRLVIAMIAGISITQIFLIYGYSAYSFMPEPLLSIWNFLGADSYGSNLLGRGPVALKTFMILSLSLSIITYIVLSIISNRKK
jgi:hypothetical protein